MPRGARLDARERHRHDAYADDFILLRIEPGGLEIHRQQRHVCEYGITRRQPLSVEGTQALIDRGRAKRLKAPRPVRHGRCVGFYRSPLRGVGAQGAKMQHHALLVRPPWLVTVFEEFLRVAKDEKGVAQALAFKIGEFFRINAVVRIDAGIDIFRLMTRTHHGDELQ